MKLKLMRTKLGEVITNGQLYIEGEYFCFTLEDKVREQDGVSVEKWKVQDQTAIPRGIYDVVLEDSPHFGTDTPTILNVPGYKYIRMHSGNTDKDTDGCIIVGYRLNDAGIIIPGTSRPALADLRKKLKGAQDKITIQVV